MKSPGESAALYSNRGHNHESYATVDHSRTLATQCSVPAWIPTRRQRLSIIYSDGRMLSPVPSL
jgi:hypothetical protein